MTELVVATGDDLVRMRPQSNRWRAERLLSGRAMQYLVADSRNQGSSSGNDWSRLELAEADVFSPAVSPVDGALGPEP
jgi:hypothetical protein